MYTNSASKCSEPKILAMGDSDHMGVMFTKMAREPITIPKVVLKRSYRLFNSADFLSDTYS